MIGTSQLINVFGGGPVEAQFLVIAGGGGGNDDITLTSKSGAGGGAGEYLEKVFTIENGENYSVTIPAGGGRGVKGSNAVFATSGSQVTTFDFTLNGGGTKGIYNSPNISNGGSGAGGNIDSYFDNPSDAGISVKNEAAEGSLGNDGANATQNTAQNGAGGCGGGGGAGSAGVAGGVTSGGAGGTGAFSDITGTSIERAGGGAGGVYNPASSGTLASGTGGGGNGGGKLGTSETAPTSGTANTGGGGGGGHMYNSNHLGRPGGSGVLIVKYSSSLTPTISSGLTSSIDTSSVAGAHIITFTAGSGTVSWN